MNEWELMVKIALCGKMASGKTTLANKFVDEYDGFGRFSLADAVKRFARFVYDIPEGVKDRVAFQKIGDGARKELYENIWIDAVLNLIAQHEEINELENGNEGFVENFVIDDVRYLNEVEYLKKEGWITIKLDISDDLQIRRLKKTYPDNWEVHVAARNHASEAEVDQIPSDLFDLIIEASDEGDVFPMVKEYISGNMHLNHPQLESNLH